MAPKQYMLSSRWLLVIVTLWVLITVMVGLLAGLQTRKYYLALLDQRVVTGATGTDGDDQDDDTASLPPDYKDSPWRDPFLPRATAPTHYRLWFKPDFYRDGNTFLGRENISVIVNEPTKYILVHIKMMNVTATKVYSSADSDGQGVGPELEINRTFEYAANQYWVTELKEEVGAGKTVVLYLEFGGSLVNGILGYYKSTYVNRKTGVER